MGSQQVRAQQQKTRRIDPNADIKLQKELVIYYGVRDIPKLTKELIGDFNKLIARLAEKFEHDYNIDIIENTRVVKVYSKDKQVYTEMQNSTDDNSKDENDISKFKSCSNNLPSIISYKSVIGSSLIFFAASY